MVIGPCRAAVIARARWRSCAGRCRSSVEAAIQFVRILKFRAAWAAAPSADACRRRTHAACGTCCRPSVVFGSMPLTANSIARSGCSLSSLPERNGLEIAQVAGVVVVQLVVELVAGDRDLLGMQHDDVIAHVHMRAVVGLVLALEPQRNPRRQATQGFATGINDIPIAAHGRRLGEFGLHHGHFSPRRGPSREWNLKRRGSVLKDPALCKIRRGARSPLAAAPAPPRRLPRPYDI